MNPFKARIHPVSALLILVRRALGVALVVAACATSAQAGGSLPAPEIDPGSLASALTLLTGGFLLVTDRLRRK